jgi:uncharacterized protein YaaN involved in tellurite resistance
MTVSKNIEVLPPVVAIEQRFQELNLGELGLSSQDFDLVAMAAKDLDSLDTTAVAEYGKNIASKTASCTDELLGLVKNKDLDETGQKLNQVVRVAQNVNVNALVNPNRPKGFFGAISKFRGMKQNMNEISTPPKSKSILWFLKLNLLKQDSKPVLTRLITCLKV